MIFSEDSCKISPPISASRNPVSGGGVPPPVLPAPSVQACGQQPPSIPGKRLCPRAPAPQTMAKAKKLPAKRGFNCMSLRRCHSACQ